MSKTTIQMKLSAAGFMVEDGKVRVFWQEYAPEDGQQKQLPYEETQEQEIEDVDCEEVD